MVPGPEPDPELAVVTSFYNPCGYKRPVENWHLFARQMSAQGLPLFTIELSFDGRYELPEGPGMHRVASSSVLWHKERLLNLLVGKLPSRFSKIAWVDCDLFWENPAWHQRAVAALEKFPVVQLFGEITSADRHDRATVTHASAMRSSDGRPGGAWLARRDFWSQCGGLYDRHIIGGGDSVAWYAFTGQLDASYIRRHPHLEFDASDWMKGVNTYVQSRAGYINERIIHRWHGDHADRRYSERNALLRLYYSSRGVVTNMDGCLEWAPGTSDELIDGVKDYFFGRHEDGRPQGNEHVMVAAYYSGEIDPQRGYARGEDWELAAPWVCSLHRLGLKGVILHDGLSESFQKRCRAHGVDCFQYPSQKGLGNSQRYDWYSAWLSANSFRHAIFTDLFDVHLNQNPFPHITKAYDLYVGVEAGTIAENHWLCDRLDRAYGEGKWPDGLKTERVLNCGIIGGSREPLRRLFGRIIRDRDAARRAGRRVLNDMPFFNVAVHEEFEAGKVWTRGAPLHSTFKAYDRLSSAAIIHK